MDKSPDAFRTISEVAEILETPAHVLRFWETRFPQIKPVKRAGGRRYYRPADLALLAGIRRLLHDEGLTIRDVQKMLRDQGVRFVSAPPESGSEPENATEVPEVTEAPPPDNVVAFGERPAGPPAPAAPAMAAEPVEPALPDAPEAIVIPVPAEFALTEPEDSEPPLKAAPSPPRPASAPPPGQTSFDFDLLEPAGIARTAAPVESPLFPEGASDSWDQVPITHVGTASDDDLQAPADTPMPPADRPWLPARLRALSAADLQAHVATLRDLLPRLLALQDRLSGKRRGARG